MTAENDAQPDRTEAFMARAMADWGDAVYRLALSQTRSKADAEDVYQDVFMRLYGDATEFTSSEHLKAWLLRVTINRCRDLAKSNWNRHTVAFDPVRDDIAPRVHGFEQERVGSKRFRAVAGCGGLVFSLERQAHAFTSLVTIRARV